MSSKARPAFRILRYSAFFLMALMLLVRLGPLCETMAMAATPAASAMIDCASESKQNPAKKIHRPPVPCLARRLLAKASSQSNRYCSAGWPHIPGSKLPFSAKPAHPRHPLRKSCEPDQFHMLISGEYQ